jgi:asparagine synthase (glutamine-hydrolysing)
MSGICGIVCLEGTSVAQHDLDRQMAQLGHRGPDRARTWSSGPAGLGHLLMRVTREDAFDVQPLSDCGLTLVADVRLDNREELATLLSIDAAALAVMPDSAMLLAAFKKWGSDCVEKLLGDFAFAVWDAASRTLTLARDHMGQRPIFYHQQTRFFAFATEIKGLWALPQVPRVVLEEQCARRLMFDEPMEIGSTIYEGIRGLPGGTVLTLDSHGAVTSRRYWEPHADPAHEGRDEAYYIETYRRILREAVECRLRRATWPAGLFMGGGFDSSAICALAGPVVNAQGRKLIAVSSVMPEDYRGDIKHARRWVDMCRRIMPHIDVHYVTRDGLDIFSFMEQSFLTGDNRHSTNRYVTHTMFAEIAKTGARIVMDGHGGDYTVNPRGHRALVRLLHQGRLRRFVAEFNATRKHLGQSVKQTLARQVLWQIVPTLLKDILSGRRNGLALVGSPAPLSRALIDGRQPKRVQRNVGIAERPRFAMLRILRDQQNYAAQGFAVPAARHGLEFTQPFHDKRVVEFGLAIPIDLYVKNGKTRYLARTALKDLYPAEYQDRPPGNDDMNPDFLAMAKRVEPRVLAEIERMEKAGYLSRYFDFPKIRAMLTRRSAGQHASGNENDTLRAHLAFIAARYIEWFRGSNA